MKTKNFLIKLSIVRRIHLFKFMQKLKLSKRIDVLYQCFTFFIKSVFLGRIFFITWNFLKVPLFSLDLLQTNQIERPTSLDLMEHFDICGFETRMLNSLRMQRYKF